MVGDALSRLSELPNDSVHCVVTSPPYFGLRNYGVDGQIGLESTPSGYVESLSPVFSEVFRVLRPDGTMWLNMGDSYGRGSRSKSKKDHLRGLGSYQSLVSGSGDYGAGERVFQDKQLMGIPWRVAFSLQDAGWYLRQDIIWHKPAPMPESVRDRCVKAHEYLFLMSKSSRYFYDIEAVKEEAKFAKHHKNWPKIGGSKHSSDRPSDGVYTGKTPVARARRNRRSVWKVHSKRFKGAHFAVMPEALAEPCIAAGTSEHGCCSSCLSPYRRVVEKVGAGTRIDGNARALAMGHSAHGPTACNRAGEAAIRKTVGWVQTCGCNADVIPCTVLDPFSGAGTTGIVSLRMGRSYIGIELNPEYVEMSIRRAKTSGINVQWKLSVET